MATSQTRLDNKVRLSQDGRNFVLRPATAPANSLFEIQQTVGRGRGFVAAVDIPRGTRIAAEEPMLVIPTVMPDQLEVAIMERFVQLAPVDQRHFLSLENRFIKERGSWQDLRAFGRRPTDAELREADGRYRLAGIARSNALPCGRQSVIGGVFAWMALINHSCVPNAHHQWNEEKGCMTVYAICDIPVGDEITISYSHADSYKARQMHFAQCFGFDCNCPLCLLPIEELLASDARRKRIKELDKEIEMEIKELEAENQRADTERDQPQQTGEDGRPPQEQQHRPRKKPQDGGPENERRELAYLDKCDQLMTRMQEEFHGNAGVLLGHVYHKAFRIAFANGDSARAFGFVEFSYRVWSMFAGEDSREAKRLLEAKGDLEGLRRLQRDPLRPIFDRRGYHEQPDSGRCSDSHMAHC